MDCAGLALLAAEPVDESTTGDRRPTSRSNAMQFGIFTVGDVTTDPTTGRTPTEAERIKAMVAIAQKAEEVGLDVFATGEHHNPPFVPSSPTTMLGYIAAKTDKLILSTSTTLITT